LTVSFSQLKNINLAPVYVSQDIAVCLDCGHTEFTLPAAKLDQLKQATFEGRSPSSGEAGSINS
jgi:hypothetical protein